MDINQFVERSIGQWRSQRSAHHLLFGHFEAVRSTIDITMLTVEDHRVIELCSLHKVSPELVISPFHMCWEGESDWDEDEQETLKGDSVLVPVPTPNNPKQGQLLRDQGYAETVPAIGEYHFTSDGTFVLSTSYDRAAAEEKIWFVSPNLRFRVSIIKTSDGAGVVTASFASEVRNMGES